MRIRAKYIFDGSTLLTDGELCVRDGRIMSEGDGHVEDLGQVLIWPGMVNAHSHAFQRLIRGRTEHVLASQLDDDFWTWRDQMYGRALTLSPDEIYAASKLAYQEMALTGVTSVGEFHYLHHDTDGGRYADPNETAHQVIRAARDVGLRICVLMVAYHRGGFQRAADEGQRRFVEPDVDAFLSRVDDLQAAYADDDFVTVGVAPHSIRAVPGPWLTQIADYAAGAALPLHIHACEQRREIQESLAEYGSTPLVAFEDLGLFQAHTTLVHATHLSPDDLSVAASLKPMICACPTTERNLGDGFLPASPLWEHNVDVCVGSDSHANIDLWEDVRLIEYHERLRLERRNVLATIEARNMNVERRETWQALANVGARNGAKALSMPAGTLTDGQFADFTVIDLNHITLRGSDATSLLNDVLLSMTPGAIVQTYVGGVRLRVAENELGGLS